MKYKFNCEIKDYQREEDLPSEFEDNLSEIKKFLIQNLACPYPNISDERLNMISSFLYDMWYSICLEYSIDSEHNFIYYDKAEAELFLLDEDLELELYPTIIRVRRWITLAEQTFEELYRPYICILATEGEYSKHYSTIEYSLEKLKTITKYGKPSKFYFRPNNELFERILDFCLLHFFFDIQHTKNLKIAIDCDKDIGVDDGEVTKYILMEIDIGSRTAHCRPIKEVTYKSDRFDLDPIMPNGECYDEHLLNTIYFNRNGLRIKYINNFADSIILENRLVRK